MKLIIRDFCIRCGLCEDLHGQLFHFDHDADAIEIKYDDIPAKLQEEARQAIADCSIAAIHLVAS